MKKFMLFTILLVTIFFSLYGEVQSQSVDSSSTFTNLLEQTGIDLLNFSKQTALQVYQFIEVEAPLLLDEWIMWNFWTSLIAFIGSIGFIGLATVIVNLGAKTIEWKDRYHDERKTNYWKKWDHENLSNTVFTFIIILYTVGLIISCWAFDWVQILIAPRLWILENIKELINL